MEFNKLKKYLFLLKMSNNDQIRFYISDSKQNKVPIRINLSDKVSKIYEILKKKKVINGDIMLTFNGQILEPDQTLNEIDIEEDCIITCMSSFPAGTINNYIDLYF